jgi:hypothetical protein
MKPGTFVRYAESGPSGAIRGCIGRVVAPDKKAQERGWTRVRFAGIIGNYDSRFLERATFWTFNPWEPARAWNSWSDATAELCQLIEAHYDSFVETGDKESAPALWGEAESAMAAIRAAPETVSGLSVAYAGAEYGIKVGGPIYR